MPGNAVEGPLSEREIDRPDRGDPSERAVLRKVFRRLVPYLFLLYVANILDRSNISFARLTMLADLGLDETVYGWGATFCFYLGYLAFEVPSNLILHRVGARLWIGRIMITWGLVSTCTMFVREARDFYIIRILLGVAEAGFFPGIVLYLSYWFPARERARAVACFMMASPLSSAFGGVVSGWLLDHADGAAGLKGWQWLFLIEGLPAVILGIVTWFYLTDRPAAAGWLSPDERDWLDRRMAREDRDRVASHGLDRLQALGHPLMVLFVLLYFTIALGTNSFGFYAPKILRGTFTGWSTQQIGYLYLVPNLTTAIAMYVIGRHSDATGERRWHIAGCALIAAIGWWLSATVQSPWLALLALTMASAGMISMIGLFWSLATSYLSGLGAVGGIALINTIANTGGAFSSPLMSSIKKTTGSFAAGQVLLGVVMLAGAGIALAIRHDQGRSADRGGASGPQLSD